MKLIELIPDPEVLCALEPDELGLRMLPALVTWRQHYQSNTLSIRDLVHVMRTDHQYGPYWQHPGRHFEVETALREAWAWLESAVLLIPDPQCGPPHTIRTLSRRARRLAEEPDARKVFAARRIPKDSLHPSIREDVWSLYHRGKYDTAVFEAMKAVEVAVRTAAGLEPKDIGIALMRKAFDPDSGPLRDPQAEKSERDARAHLFAGAIGSYKNPQSHRKVDLDDPDETAEIIMLANHLLRIVDTRREGP